jgi:inosine/xanthosine triphosphatase
MKIVVASTNPVKIDCTRLGFARVFPHAVLDISGISVPSGVPDQPMGDAETLQGALNRAANARAQQPDVDYWVGIEGGLESIDSVLFAFAWIVVMSDGLVGRSRTAAFGLPEEVATLIHQGYELGDADDRVFGRNNSKQGNGSVGLLTGDLMDRTDFYKESVVLALIPFINPSLTFSRNSNKRNG